MSAALQLEALDAAGLEVKTSRTMSKLESTAPHKRHTYMEPSQLYKVKKLMGITRALLGHRNRKLYPTARALLR